MRTKLSLPNNLGSGEMEIEQSEMRMVGKFFNSVVPGFVKETMGILSDNAKFARWKNFIKITKEANEISEKYNLPELSAKLPIAFEVPFIEQASLQENETMQKMWANLLANAAANNSSAKTIYVSILKELTPSEALVLDMIHSGMKEKGRADPAHYSISLRIVISKLKENNSDYQTVVDNLYRLRLITNPPIHYATATSIGFGTGLLNFGTGGTSVVTTTYDGENRILREVSRYLETERRSRSLSENSVQLTSLGYSLIKACNEPTEENKEDK